MPGLRKKSKIELQGKKLYLLFFQKNFETAVTYGSTALKMEQVCQFWCSIRKNCSLSRTVKARNKNTFNDHLVHLPVPLFQCLRDKLSRYFGVKSSTILFRVVINSWITVRTPTNCPLDSIFTE